MRAVGGVFVPLIVGICLPILESQATAAETASVDEAKVWNVVVEPGVSIDGLLKRVALQDTGVGEAVPAPVEPGDAAPVDEFAQPEIVPIQSVPAEGTDEFAIEPGNAMPAENEANSGDEPLEDVASTDYWPIYQSIPFSRSAYDANHAYRHDATMELLTGKARPAVIHHHHEASNRGFQGPPAAAIPPYVYDVYLGQIPTFVQRYLPPAIPFGYPLVY